MKRVKPRRLFANGLWNPFTHRKKYTVVCGECEHTFDEKVSFVTDNATAVCPACGALNYWLHSDWQKSYDEQLR
jgi:hypothetical protein